MAGIMSAGSAEGDFSPVPRAVITGNAESISAARCASRPRPVAAPRYSQAGRGAIHRRWTRALLLLHQVLGRAARCRLLHRHRRRLRSPDARARVARRRPERAHGRRRHGGDVGGAGVPAAVADDPARAANLDAQNDIGWHAVVWAGSNAPGMVTATRKLADLGMDVKAARRPASTRAASGSRCARG